MFLRWRFVRHCYRQVSRARVPELRSNRFRGFLRFLRNRKSVTIPAVFESRIAASVRPIEFRLRRFLKKQFFSQLPDHMLSLVRVLPTRPDVLFSLSVVRCEAPLPPPNGRVVYSGKFLPAGEIVTYICNAGHVLIGHSQVTR